MEMLPYRSGDVVEFSYRGSHLRGTIHSLRKESVSVTVESDHRFYKQGMRGRYRAPERAVISYDHIIRKEGKA